MGASSESHLLSDPTTHRPVLGAHRLLSNGQATALIGTAACVNWWCGPEMDSPPLLWSLLDPTGAAARWCGAEEIERSSEPAGPVVRSVLRVGGTRIECHDALVEEGLVRLVRAIEADLDVAHELSIGGFDQPWGFGTGRAATSVAPSCRSAAGCRRQQGGGSRQHFVPLGTGGLR